MKIISIGENDSTGERNNKWSCRLTNYRSKWIIAMLVLCLSPGFKALTQVTEDYSVHANIIYHFTKYINWPARMKEGDFVIGIVGNSPLYHELKRTMSNKTARNQPIVVKQFPKSQTQFDCHILFIPEDASGSVKKIADKTAGSPVLLVSEEEGMASKGACINFTVVAERLKLEINKTNIEQRRLNIASELLRLGKIVK